MSVPTLEAYLSRHVSESRADGYEEFAAFADRLLEMSPATASEAATLRWLRLFAVAVTEGLRTEHARGEDEANTMGCLAKTAGYIAHSVIMAHARADAPPDPLVRFLTDGFRAGAEESARSIREDRQQRSEP